TPVALRAGLAVRADKEVHDRFGPQNGAIAIVLDCSGSMGPSYDQGEKWGPTTKYNQATDALEKGLSELPEGGGLSLFGYGQAGPPGMKTVEEAEETIRAVRLPKRWERKQLEGLMREVRYPALEPWNQTPLVRAMWRAKQEGFPANFKGFKTLLVLTDGMDT